MEVFVPGPCIQCKLDNYLYFFDIFMYTHMYTDICSRFVYYFVPAKILRPSSPRRRTGHRTAMPRPKAVPWRSQAGIRSPWSGRFPDVININRHSYRYSKYKTSININMPWSIANLCKCRAESKGQKQEVYGSVWKCSMTMGIWWVLLASCDLNVVASDNITG